MAYVGYSHYTTLGKKKKVEKEREENIENEVMEGQTICGLRWILKC